MIPAFTFHWVQGRDDVSIAMTCVVGTSTTARESAVHEFNLRVRKLGLQPSPPGRNARVDRAKEKVVRGEHEGQEEDSPPLTELREALLEMVGGALAANRRVGCVPELPNRQPVQRPRGFEE